jgi:predicted GNAT family acetyltransferase
VNASNHPRKVFRRLKIDELTSDLLPNVRLYLERDPIPNVYLLQNLGTVKEKPLFYVATDGDQNIAGVLLIRTGLRAHPIAWLLAESHQAAAELIKFVEFPEVLVWTSDELESVFEKELDGRIKSKSRFNAMVLERLSTDFEIKQKWRKLSAADYREWARLNVMMDSEQSGGERREPTEKELETARGFLERSASFGIFVGDDLVSTASVEVLSERDSIIRRVFTLPDFRGRGLAKRAALLASSEALNHSKRALLFVRKDNYPAVKVYNEIGFTVAAERVQFEL